MGNVLILQNAPLFTAGSFEDELKRRGISYEYRLLFDGEKLPSIEQAKDYSGYLVLGGPLRFKVDLPEKSGKKNWVAEELFFLRACLDQHKPIFGVSQGAVLLARAQGASIKKLEEKQVGWMGAEIYPDYSRNSVIYSLVDQTKFPVLMWTDSMSGFPPEGYWYLNTPTCRYLSVGVHGNCYAFNFHPEVTEPLLGSWLKEYAQDLHSKEDAVKIRQQAAENMEFTLGLSRKIMNAFQSFLK